MAVAATVGCPKTARAAQNAAGSRRGALWKAAIRRRHTHDPCLHDSMAMAHAHRPFCAAARPLTRAALVGPAPSIVTTATPKPRPPSRVGSRRYRPRCPTPPSW